MATTVPASPVIPSIVCFHERGIQRPSGLTTPALISPSPWDITPGVSAYSTTLIVNASTKTTRTGRHLRLGSSPAGYRRKISAIGVTVNANVVWPIHAAHCPRGSDAPASSTHIAYAPAAPPTAETRAISEKRTPIRFPGLLDVMRAPTVA